MTEDYPAIEVPRVVLVTPHYGNVSMGLLSTIRSASRDREMICMVREATCSHSVLPKTFNDLFAISLDLRDNGVATHMAMCHSDIVAEPGWIDTLWYEMWHYKLDVISAVVPIKGPTGRTSTAIGLKKDRWAVKRCVNLKDRETLGETFGAQQACQPGEVLLINTGLMLVDLRRDYWDRFAFQFHTRIRKTPGGRISEARSEDWEMSHDLAEIGAPYMATFKPRLRHEGLAKFANYPEAT